MSEPYYRISTAQSELERILYAQAELKKRLNKEGRLFAQRKINDGVPRLGSIKATHRFPFRTRFRPVVISAAQWISHGNATNRRFTIEYGGELMGRMYQAVDFSVGTITSNAVSNAGGTAAWSYCRNFIASYLDLASFKISTDTLYEIPGEMLFAWYSYVVAYGRRPALQRALRETSFYFKWVPGGAAATGAGGGSVFDNLEAFHPYTPIQAFAVTHAAMTAYIPYTIFTLNNPENAYPIVSVYSLSRTLEYTFRTLENCVNVYIDGTGGTGTAGFVAPLFAGTGTLHTWAAVPAMSATRLMVEYFTLHKDLQRILAMNPHGFLVRQYYRDTETLTDKTLREIALTKIIETIYIICRFTRSTVHTAVSTGVTLVTGGAGVVTNDTVYEIDPYSLPTNTKPINNITLSARGQPFFKNLDWEEISAVWSFLYSTAEMGTTENHCIAVITFGIWYYTLLHTSTYNSGFGPNLRLAWVTHAFGTAANTSGLLEQLIQSINMALAYRGAFSIRYT